MALLVSACGGSGASSPTGATSSSTNALLSSDEVRRIVEQAAAAARTSGFAATIAVTDAEANVLGVFRMDGAAAVARVSGAPGAGLQGALLPSDRVAIAKAATGALLSSGGNAFSTRTASFIVQAHFPPAVDFTPGGPLFGVQFSSLACGDFKRPGSPLGLAGDPGGLPLYRDGHLIGGIGVEGDGVYGVDTDPADLDAPPEESVALAGAVGLEAPDLIRASQILADGIRLAYTDATAAPAGSGAVAGTWLVSPQAAQRSTLVAATVGGVSGRVDPHYPVRAGAILTAADVASLLDQAARQTSVTRAAIRQPLGSNARVSIAVVDLSGAVLGFFQNDDAPNFGIDVSVQKARTAAFFSGPGAGDALRRAGLGAYVPADLRLDGQFAYTSRAVGFMAQPFFPPGIPGSAPGPFSLPIEAWSPFNTGLQLDLLNLAGVGSCSAVPGLPNGITVFPGGIPVWKDGRLAGAIGVSGDGVDQDDLIAAAGSAGFEIPAERRSDTIEIRGVRLPWVKLPRHPEL